MRQSFFHSVYMIHRFRKICCLKSVAQKRDFFAYDGDDVEAIGVTAQVVVGNEFFGRAAQDLLLPPVHEFPRFAELPRAPRLDLDENQDVPFKGDNVQFARPRAVATRQDVEALPEEVSAGQTLSLPSREKMRRNHTLNVCRGRALFHMN